LVDLCFVPRVGNWVAEGGAPEAERGSDFKEG
jgi:hypothetical protein